MSRLYLKLRIEYRMEEDISLLVLSQPFFLILPPAMFHIHPPTFPFSPLGLNLEVCHNSISLSTPPIHTHPRSITWCFSQTPDFGRPTCHLLSHFPQSECLIRVNQAHQWDLGTSADARARFMSLPICRRSQPFLLLR